ncbi:sensor domain-containing diguanylate cyclase [Wenzhouxiangella sediminis]|uniref:diguanylate cyclase n=1 Tax=Wenzhouxiangella sediminis TaxID=1792836 RepID=A0A3E1K687_9GAMM|nr:sensor domain-containing diguanylate cyclase [Wenzhouxiangella sediminis]RFF29543.1 sensor domain-containing diguanylate cyclase [Wenzhouxiangella sediminis]
MLPARNRFVIALLALLGSGFLLTSVLSYFVAEHSMDERIAGEILPLTSDNVYSEIERDLLRSILISSLMANDTFVRDWITAGEEDPQAIVRYLREIQREYGTTTAFFVSEDTHNYYHPTGIIKQVAPDDPADGWYFRARRMTDDYEINIDHDTADRSRLSIFVNYRVVDGQGRFLGLTGIGLAVEQVVELIESYERRYSRDIYFVDRDGAVTLASDEDDSHPDLQQRPGLAQFATRILTNPSTSLTYQNEQGETVFLNSRLVPEFGWYLLVEQSKNEAEGQLLRALGVNIILALTITGLILGLVYVTLNRYQRRLEQMATTDKLTGAANRHVFQMLFGQVVGNARRRNEAVALMCIDLDGFKTINDRYGHQAGDGVLRQFADVANSIIRESDTLCRWGGDEFLVLMAGCNASQAAQVAEKIRKVVDERSFTFSGKSVELTISIGVTEVAMEDAMESVVARADQALYQAKEAGRNRVASL